jgi:hypothetical protein
MTGADPDEVDPEAGKPGAEIDAEGADDPGVGFEDGTAPLRTAHPRRLSCECAAHTATVRLMPTLEHNGLLEMFRENPALAPHLLDLLLHVKLPPYASVAVVEAALDQLIPVEFRADLVLELRDDLRALVLAIVLELQREKDPRKKGSWPMYVAAVHARKGCPTIVLVVTSDTSVATWAAEPIDLGLGLSIVRPLVLGPATVPEVTDPALAVQETELSILSAVAHGNGPNGLAVALAAFEALGRLDQEHAVVYFQIVYDALRGPMQKALEAKIMERQAAANVTLPPFLQRIADGCFHDGELKGLRDALLRLVTRAEIPLSDNDRTRILACDDATTLDRWLGNVLGAKTAADVLR